MYYFRRPIEAPYTTRKKNLETGDSDDKSGKIVLQPEDVVDILKRSDNHAKRNIIAKQEQLVTELSTSQSAAEPKASKVNQKTPTRTKAQMLDEQSSSITKISSTFDVITQSQNDLLKAQADLAKVDKLKQALSLGLIDQEAFNSNSSKLLLENI